jgi:hypothetical protein
MAVRVPLKSLSSKQLKGIEESLTFEYKEKTMMRSPKFGKYKPKPKTVKCFYIEGKEISLPSAWAKRELNVVNTHVTKDHKYKKKKEPWTRKQEKEVDKVIEKLTNYGSIALTLRTGAGKTAVALFAACHFKGFTVVLVHCKDHCTQWKKAIESYTTAKCEIVETTTNGIKHDTDILICLYTRWNKVPLCVRNDVRFLLIDECDEFTNKSGIEAVLAFKANYIMGCTATFKRPGTGLEVLMEAVLGYEMVTRTFDVKFNVTKILTGIEGELVPSEHIQGNDWNTLKKSLLYNDRRNRMIVEIVKMRLDQARKIMIICTEKKHVVLLAELLDQANIDVDTLYGTKRDYIDSDVLIVTAKRGGRGFDEENFCNNWGGKRINDILIVDFVKNDADRTQWIGRSFRDDDPLIDQLVDNNQTCMRQWDAAEKMYRWMGAKITEVEMAMEETSEEVSSESLEEVSSESLEEVSV